METQVYNIAMWRDRLGLTQQQAADYLGITDRNYRSHEQTGIPVESQMAFACQYIEERIGREPKARWPAKLKGNTIVVETPDVWAHFAIKENGTLSLGNTVNWKGPQKNDEWTEAVRVAAKKLRQTVNALADIAKSTGTRQPVATVDELEEAGLITRNTTIGWRLTPRGRAIAGIRGRITRAA